MSAWLGDHWQLVIAVWGAVVSTALAAREIWRSRRRIVFDVDHYNLFTSGVQPVLITARDSSGGTPVIVIGVYNRGHAPIYLQSVGFRWKSGGFAVPVPIQGMGQLPRRVDPSDGFSAVANPTSLKQAMESKKATVAEIHRVFCKDGAARIYQRKINARERNAIAAAFVA